MSDAKTRLAATLAELHEELAGAAAADAEVRQLLSTALAEIQAKLASSEEPAAPAGATTTDGGADSVGERLRGAAIHFEESHPTLSGMINSLMETLAQLGI